MSQTQKRSLAAIRGQAHALFTGPQPSMRTPEPHPVQQQTGDKDRANPEDTRGGKDVPLVLLP
jgi:hypothetical protein